jgi:hypothetical protein
MKAIVCKKCVDYTDIVALQSGIQKSDAILNEYSSRLKRLYNNDLITNVEVRKLRSHISPVKEIRNLGTNMDEHEVDFSLKVCQFAHRLMLEGRKAEVATRMKLGETEKAVEAFEAFKEIYQTPSFHNEFLETLPTEINAKAELFASRQWFKSKKTNAEQQILEIKVNNLMGSADIVFDDSADVEMINQFTGDSEILYLLSAECSKQRVFIEAKDL